MSELHAELAVDDRVDLVACPECGNVASIEWQAWLGDLLHLKIRCIDRHWFLMPADRITVYGTDMLYVRAIDSPRAEHDGPDIRFEYSLHEPMRGRDEVRAFVIRFREAFPDLNFWGTADLIAEGDYVVGQWEGGGTHTGNVVFDDLPIGAVAAASGKTMRFTGTTVLKVVDGLIVEEIGLDDGVAVLQRLAIIPAA